jgi:XTP/dITP diphosphohydrolase
MQKLLIATQNNGKIKEILSLLDDLEMEFVTPAQMGIELDVEETGDTYADNAVLKAKAFANASGLPALADDSGLEVAALDGQPGLYSARFSPKPGATDADRREYLLTKLAPHPRPWTAQFRCIVALYTPKDERQIAEGICPGEIIPIERGHFGFGYDPVFLLTSLGKTMAELSMDEKNQLSHRARAIQAIKPIIKALFDLK